MAGSHQLWVIDLLHDQAYPYAAPAKKRGRDGAVNHATFAQPSGPCYGRQHAVCRGCESNTIRVVELPPANVVTPIAGGDLFEFGDTTARATACACSIRSA
jgi:hypothetical protein